MGVGGMRGLGVRMRGRGLWECAGGRGCAGGGSQAHGEPVFISAAVLLLLALPVMLLEDVAPFLL